MSRTYAFGAFVLDPAHRLLKRSSGEPVAITAKAFDALVCLVEHAGQVVPRAALLRALWPNTIVEDNNLSQAIAAARRALGDHGPRHRYVATVPRRGYQFVADVRVSDDAEHGSAHSPTVEPALGPPSEPLQCVEPPRVQARAVPRSVQPHVAPPRAQRRTLVTLAVSISTAAMALVIALLVFWRSSVEEAGTHAPQADQTVEWTRYEWPLPAVLACAQESRGREAALRCAIEREAARKREWLYRHETSDA